jgi:hypothetical protein
LHKQPIHHSNLHRLPIHTLGTPTIMKTSIGQSKISIPCPTLHCHRIGQCNRFAVTFYPTTGQPQWGKISFSQNTGKKTCPTVLAVQKNVRNSRKKRTNIQLLRLSSSEHKKRIPTHYRNPFLERTAHNDALGEGNSTLPSRQTYNRQQSLHCRRSSPCRGG